MDSKELSALLTQMEDAIRKNQQQFALQAILKLRTLLGEKIQQDSKAKNQADYEAALGSLKIPNKPAEIGMHVSTKVNNK